MTSVLGRGEIGRLATAGAAVVPITTSLSLGTSVSYTHLTLPTIYSV